MTKNLSAQRYLGRGANQLRPLRIIAGVNPYAEGSVEVSAGNTKLLITATVETEVPAWMKESARGWITAEYGMLPRSTHTRNRREASAGKQSGRTLEIQRLIGRALRAALRLEELPGITIRMDCDVICADGGTRTAAISGGWVALHQALLHVWNSGLVSVKPTVSQIAAISVGLVQGSAMVDLDYAEDSGADFDLNVVLDEQFRLVEVQGTAERVSASASQLAELLQLATDASVEIMAIQREAVSSLLSPA